MIEVTARRSLTSRTRGNPTLANRALTDDAAPGFSSPSAFVRSLESLRQQMQVCLTQPQRFHGGGGRDHIIAVGARLPMALSDVVQWLRQREAAGILDMAAVDHVAPRRDLAGRLAPDRDATPAFPLHPGGLLARP